MLLSSVRELRQMYNSRNAVFIVNPVMQGFIATELQFGFLIWFNYVMHVSPWGARQKKNLN